MMTVALSNAPVIPRPTVTISGSYSAGFTFTFLTVASSNVVYYLDYRTNRTSPAVWNAITSTPGTGAAANLSDSNPSGAERFYRVRVQ